MAQKTLILTHSKWQKLHLFDALIFLYFFTLHADQLKWTLGDFNFRFNNVVALLLLSALLVRFKKIALDRKLFGALVWMGLAILLSLILSAYPKRCFFFFLWYCVTVLCYVMVPYILMTQGDQNKILKLYFYAFLFVGLYATFQTLLPLVGLKDPFAIQTFNEKGIRASAFAYEPSYYALYMTPFVMMVNFHYLYRSQKPFFIFEKITWRHLFLVNGFFLLSLTTSTVFAYLFFILTLFAYGFYKRNVPLLKKTALFGFLLICSGAVFALFFPNLIKQFFLKFFFSGFSEHTSFTDRWLGIINAWKVFLQNPFFGVGLGALPNTLYDAFLSSDNQFSYLFETVDQTNPLHAFEPSNTFTELLASLGLFGTFAFLNLLILFFRRAAKIHSHVLLNFTLSVFITLLILQFNQGLFRTYIWTHLAIAFAFMENCRQDESIA